MTQCRFWTFWPSLSRRDGQSLVRMERRRVASRRSAFPFVLCPTDHDGGTAAAKEQGLVDLFSSHKKEEGFLLE